MSSFVWTIFAFGTFWFWALVVIDLIIITASVETYNSDRATWSVILTLLALQFFGGIPIFHWIITHPGWATLGVGAYLVLGTGYAILKWTSYVYKCRDEVVRHGSWSRPPSYKARTDAPQAAEQKAVIISWMCYWPLSAIWTLLNDPIRRIFNKIYNDCEKLLQNISNRAFANVNKQ